MVELGRSKMRVALHSGPVLLFFPDELCLPVEIRVAVLVIGYSGLI